MSIKSASAALMSILAVAVFLAGCQEEAAPPAQQKPKVGIVTVQTEPFAVTTDLPGRTRAYRIAEVRPQVNGIIQKRLFTEGSDVKAGQQLYQIDASVYEATLKSAQASLASSKSLADRYAELVKDQAVSKQAYDEARAASLQAEAELERARIDLRYTKVLAPISGRIGRSAVTEGALVSNGQAQELATIQQLDPIYVDVTQPARDLLALRRDLAEGRLQKSGENAARVSLKLEDGSDYGHEGKLEFSEVTVDPGTGSVTLRAVFPNPDKILLPGMFVHAQLVAGLKSEAMLVPQQGVTRNAKGEPTAMVVNAENKVELRTIKTERAVGNRWLVGDGLQPGDRVITEGLQFIQPGVEVEVAPATNVDNRGVSAQPQGQEG
ncbi:MAG TPA: efflux RND transporter periplasmic adaptor subunit [Pseudomonas sp.]|uniref:efflux RND transporter periplasmic adaptor subunit n=1 Tax=Stutzerimonas TaxID=2901164 RepID=UPI0007BA2054|nr:MULTISPECIES: efflux RND transporter periplasmic adaptor subunit [Stutzerimonas]MAL91008.1 efflux RND transporter periplasmic adaptor subunit [Pseudomonas sp.]MCD1637275.1 efflux RND transporter periplasmic adaptor subunit [Stutzerimonas stutzeri]MEC7474373.1 efflux RND transporter periplasmic adaptor subunit [Pseudomonadota bacterium]TDL97141.1 efflux RND transporter periplasmic adaptor subunit [Stutzerimonas stutzeri ATCC 17588 = LMG 11199]KZX62827.1 efflux transporter periplasmic adaptor|tara:strand:- start:7245 stop:8384 length:1140 start_codon:yes stop_codon:yes gene_type:complete